jgi:hypothetical protein
MFEKESSSPTLRRATLRRTAGYSMVCSEWMLSLERKTFPQDEPK